METTLEKTIVGNENRIANLIERKVNEIAEASSYWICDACGGDSYTGCMMSDPGDYVMR